MADAPGASEDEGGCSRRQVVPSRSPQTTSLCDWTADVRSSDLKIPPTLATWSDAPPIRAFRVGADRTGGVQVRCVDGRCTWSKRRRRRLLQASGCAEQEPADDVTV